MLLIYDHKIHFAEILTDKKKLELILLEIGKIFGIIALLVALFVDLSLIFTVKILHIGFRLVILVLGLLLFLAGILIIIVLLKQE